MSIPGIVPWIQDREVYAGVPDTATLTRRLVRWTNWARGRLTRATPCDAPYRSGGLYPPYPGVTTRVGSFLVLPSPLPCRTLKAWVTHSGGAGVDYVEFRSRRTGRVLGRSATWDQTTIDTSCTLTGVDAPDVVEVHFPCASGTGRLGSIGAYWDARAEAPSGVTLDAAWGTMLKFGWASAGRTDGAFFLRWLARRANQMMADRPRQVVATANARSGSEGVMLTGLRVAAKVPSIRIRIRANGAAAPAWTALDPAGASGNGTAFSGPDANGYYTSTITTGFAVPTTIRVYWSVPSTSPAIFTPGPVYTPIIITEDEPTATSLGLVGGDAVPGAFTALEERAMVSRTPIFASQRELLLQNMVWLLAKKTRVLASVSNRDSLAVAGSRLNYVLAAAADGWAKQIRCYAGRRRQISAGLAVAEGKQQFAWAKWADPTWTDLAYEPVPEDSRLYPDTAGAYTQPIEWISTDDHQMASGEERLVYRHWLNPDSDAVYAEASEGGCFEELPDGTPLTAWP